MGESLAGWGADFLNHAHAKELEGLDFSENDPGESENHPELQEICCLRNYFY